MRHPNVDDSVRLVNDLPDLLLPAGAVGVVYSTWFGANVAYEVEFQHVGDDATARVLLRDEDVELVSADDRDACADVERSDRLTSVG